MKTIIGYCGLSCHECPAYIATQTGDGELRKKTAEEWSAEYQSDFKPEDILCEGCTTGSQEVFNYCKICEIRKCAREMEVINCAYCDHYPCKKLDEFFEMVPAAHEKLDQIRESIS